ncbi:CBS domain-containing protein [Afipia felis]|uniref:Inosine-5'-monophosphate dehydrogenase n=2 Tax=Afipia felis TaxID=1035 RepID=A0A380WEA8_AFIFE|nr:CBS domain-containing protein [Afipia felis]EKS29745.1 hypothetical protein HMPREF9697_02273 [Afipia felis ATCC 53690]SUU78452.1 Inosine-5'-monophosphate dehydrogenase [Afipia felis]SUU86517.1 Inosine-5'-monophosphate dehydrogenase [Afipia felis]
MKVRDVMTKHLVSILPDVHVREAAQMMASNGISALTVVDELGSLVGILSEGDLLHRRELNTETRRSWWLDLFASDRDLAADYVKSHSRRVRDVMTTKVIAASPDDTLGEVARRFEKHHIKRMPVIENGRLIGIVTRANLVQALASTKELPSPRDTDAMIKREIDHRIAEQPWARRPFSICVSNGNVDITGIVYNDNERDAIRVVAENTPGVGIVVNNLRVVARPIEDG